MTLGDGHMDVASQARPLRILLAIGSLNPADGGPPESMRTLADGFRLAGHACDIVTLDPHDAPWLKADWPCPVTSVQPTVLGRYRYSPAFRRWAAQNVGHYDVVVVNGIFQYLGLALRAACRRQGVPYVVFTHGSLDPWFRRQFPLKHLKKWLHWPWGDYPLLRDAARVLFTTDEERDLAPQSFSLYRVRPAVVGYGTDDPPPEAPDDADTLYAAHPALRNRRYLLFLSRIDAKKGCDILLEAFGRCADLDPTLLLVMAGPDRTGLRPALEARSEQMGVGDRVVWTGPLAGATKWAAFRHAEAYVLASHTENFGIAVAEALACGTPVLISERVNIWRSVVRGGAGLAAPDTVEGTVRLLNQWNELSPAEKVQMRSRTRPLFLEQFEMGAVSRRIGAVLAECARDARKPQTEVNSNTPSETAP